MRKIIIAARAKNGVIGNLNTIPWHLPADLQHFKRTTMGGVMLMGSRTWESFGCRALPDRQHVVISSRPALQVREKDQGVVHHVTTLEAGMKLGGFLAHTANPDDPTLFVIGGAQVYEQAMGLVDELIITEIDREYSGDRFFPEVNPKEWTTVRTYLPDATGIPYRIITYARANG